MSLAVHSGNRRGTIVNVMANTIATEPRERNRLPGSLKSLDLSQINFHKPVFVGDLVSLYCETVRVGRTSITVRVIVEVERLGNSERVRVTEAEVIYVAVDQKGEKIPIVTK